MGQDDVRLWTDEELIRLRMAPHEKTCPRLYGNSGWECCCTKAIRERWLKTLDAARAAHADSEQASRQHAEALKAALGWDGPLDEPLLVEEVRRLRAAHVAAQRKIKRMTNQRNLLGVSPADEPIVMLSESQYQALEAAQREVERLRAWVDDLQSGMYVNCVYCGHRYGPGETTPVSMADALKAHVEQCGHHPMSALRAQLTSAHAALAKIKDECLLGVSAGLGNRIYDLCCSALAGAASPAPTGEGT